MDGGNHCYHIVVDPALDLVILISLLLSIGIGNRIELTPKNSPWYCYYVVSPDVGNSRFQVKFWRHFLLPFDEFQKLVARLVLSPLFERWLSFDAIGQAASPIELMVLGALRYLGRGWTFDDIEEETAVHEETHRQFFHVFIRWGSSELYDSFVKAPSTSEAAYSYMSEMESTGFHGCVGSTDATHICMERCSYRLANAHRGAKLTLPSRTYNLTVNHRRQILSST